MAIPQGRCHKLEYGGTMRIRHSCEEAGTRREGRKGDYKRRKRTHGRSAENHISVSASPHDFYLPKPCYPSTGAVLAGSSPLCIDSLANGAGRHNHLGPSPTHLHTRFLTGCCINSSCPLDTAGVMSAVAIPAGAGHLYRRSSCALKINLRFRLHTRCYGALDWLACRPFELEGTKYHLAIVTMDDYNPSRHCHNGRLQSAYHVVL